MDRDILKHARTRIDEIDKSIVQLLKDREAEVREIAEYKALYNLPIEQPEREKELLEKVRDISKAGGMDEQYIQDIFKCIITRSRAFQGEVINKKVG